MRACCLPALAHRCIVFEVLCRRLLRLQFCFLPEQHCSERQKLAWQQREGTPEWTPWWHHRSFASVSSPNFSSLDFLPKATISQLHAKRGSSPTTGSQSASLIEVKRLR